MLAAWAEVEGGAGSVPADPDDFGTVDDVRAGGHLRSRGPTLGFDPMAWLTGLAASVWAEIQAEVPS